MKDSFGREIDYLRIAITDRCNLRCQYCIPNDISFLKQNELLSYEEWLRLITIFSDLGIKKVRVSGGEPLLRKDIGFFLKELKKIPSIRRFGITTNGTNTLDFLEELDGFEINVSLDSLNLEKFNSLTQRNNGDQVLSNINSLIKLGRLNKINAVIMKGKNEESLLDMLPLVKENPIQLRFIESMPFNGSIKEDSTFLSSNEMLSIVKSQHPEIEKLPDEKNATANIYHINGYKGNIGFIPAYSRSICGGCNRVRVTSEGVMKICLYDNGVLNLKELLRNGFSDKQIAEAITKAVYKKPKDGFEAEKQRENSNFESMTKIGG